MRRSGSAGEDAAFERLVATALLRGFFETGIFWFSISYQRHRLSYGSLVRYWATIRETVGCVIL